MIIAAAFVAHQALFMWPLLHIRFAKKMRIPEYHDYAYASFMERNGITQDSVVARGEHLEAFNFYFYIAFLQVFIIAAFLTYDDNHPEGAAIFIYSITIFASLYLPYGNASLLYRHILVTKTHIHSFNSSSLKCTCVPSENIKKIYLKYYRAHCIYIYTGTLTFEFKVHYANIKELCQAISAVAGNVPFSSNHPYDRIIPLYESISKRF